MPRATSTTTPSPDAVLRSLLERFDANEQKRIRSVRAALRKRLPTANELLYDYGTFVVIAYSANESASGGIVTLSARPDGLRLYFIHRTPLPDPKKLLLGTGKQTRYIGVQSAKQLVQPEVEALIVAAIAQATEPLPKTGKGRIVLKTAGRKRR